MGSTLKKGRLYALGQRFSEVTTKQRPIEDDEKQHVSVTLLRMQEPKKRSVNFQNIGRRVEGYGPRSFDRNDAQTTAHAMAARLLVKKPVPEIQHIRGIAAYTRALLSDEFAECRSVKNIATAREWVTKAYTGGRRKHLLHLLEHYGDDVPPTELRRVAHKVEQHNKNEFYMKDDCCMRAINSRSDVWKLGFGAASHALEE